MIETLEQSPNHIVFGDLDSIEFTRVHPDGHVAVSVGVYSECISVDFDLTPTQVQDLIRVLRGETA